MTLYKKYKRDNGGQVGAEESQSKLEGAMGVGVNVANVASSFAQAIDPPNQYGRQGGVTNVLKNVGTFASIGSAAGPIGTAVGAGIGLIKGLVDTSKQKREEKRLKHVEDGNRYLDSLNRYSARAGSDSTLAQGVQGNEYFANGGSLLAKYIKRRADGGSLSTLSSDTVEVKGPSHAQGGVKLGTGDEVEGGETIKGDYVLSKKLGFADAHRPIAKAIGILEKKAPTSSTMNSLQRLRDQEQALMLFQEQYRQQHNLQ